ncbi:DUF3806 domain-containing protein [Undibacterium amnicola]|uniref:DUF3806 domain-containing protein n=1 Tax=Undibacterium amnicola TaxID=1834038 RepID=A0ABR6XUH8_9BURK|nr:DUF3806 domain-containing protein [Undibacterium amnicola]MBC3833143.1 DUF3806 domain-containing protein [Undibacterium amnicola]
MEQVISAPDDEWIDYIARMWLLGSQISEQITGHKMDASMSDLGRLQTIVDSAQIPIDSTQELESLGIVFGKVFVNATANYDWWIMEDEYGKDVCIRYKETSLLIFPQTMLSKRIEDGAVLNVIDLFHSIRQELDRIKNENFANA